MAIKTFTDWETRTPALATKPEQAFVQLPAFSTSSADQVPLEADQPSHIVTQWNYNAGRKFTITELPAANSTYVLCVRFSVNGVIRRYKLWHNTAAAVDHITQYAGQVIYPYFVLEVWSLDGDTVYPVQATAMDLPVSIRRYSTDLLSRATWYDLATGAQIENLGTIRPTSPFDPDHLWFTTQGGDTEINTINDVVGSWSIAKTGTGPLGRTPEVPANPWAGFIADFDSSIPNPMSATDGTARLWDSFFVYVVAALPTYGPSPLQQSLFYLKSDSFANFVGMSIYNAAGVPNINAVSSSGASAFLPYSDTNPRVYCGRYQTTGTGVRVDKGAETAVSGISAWNSATTIHVGNDHASTYPADMSLAALAIYRRASISEDEHAAIVDHLRYIYLDELPFVTNFESGSAWTDNVE